MSSIEQVEKVSVHGGHSGQFCNHASDSLQDVIRAYIDQGFSWVGITEHMPPPADDRRYPDEVQAGLDAGALQRRFEHYFRECRELQAKFRDRIEIMTAFETEAYDGAVAYTRSLVKMLKPDYLVGSVHHVRGICIDYSPELYLQAVETCGSVEQLYCEYFDAQYQLMSALTPAVIGHFDLIRIYDENYPARMTHPEIQQRINRNLAFMKQHELILDVNLRGFDKGSEQYPCLGILQTAMAMGVSMVPGDDSHGVASVGRNFDKGINVLRQLGIGLDRELK